MLAQQCRQLAAQRPIQRSAPVIAPRVKLGASSVRTPLVLQPSAVPSCQPTYNVLPKRIVKASAAAGDAVPAPEPAETAQGTSSFVQAVLNVVNVMMGVGLLSLPFALKSSGWIGIGLLWLMGIVTNYTGECICI